MKHVKKLTPALLALIAAAGLAACGSSNGEDESEAVSGQFKLVPGAPFGYESLAGKATLERADGGTTVLLSATGLEPSTAYVAHLHSGSCDQTDPGGPHFKFNPNGSDEPPNEIHLEFSSKADGDGRATASSDREVPLGEAGSVVIHEAESEQKTAGSASEGEALLVHEGHHHEESSGPEKIACAELEGAESSDASGSQAAGEAGEPTVVIRNGEPVGGIQELEYDAGDEVRFKVESDVADEVHVHGYDLMEDVAAGGTVSFEFPAEIEGIFEVELEGRKLQIAELTVNP
ncbi:MAG TPA: hypothetical protein VFI03_03705 [Solirubrobacterales bacterium]|nr:hypothetical protein [Solirubrobacterales bacterium]